MHIFIGQKLSIFELHIMTVGYKFKTFQLTNLKLRIRT